MRTTEQQSRPQLGDYGLVFGSPAGAFLLGCSAIELVNGLLFLSRGLDASSWIRSGSWAAPRRLHTLAGWCQMTTSLRLNHDPVVHMQGSLG